MAGPKSADQRESQSAIQALQSLQNNISGTVAGSTIQVGQLNGSIHITMPEVDKTPAAGVAGRDGSTSAGSFLQKVPQTRSDLSAMLIAKPTAWEYLTYACELKLAVQDLEPKWLDHKLGQRAGSHTIRGNNQALQYISAATAQAKSIIAVANRWLSTEAQVAAFGQSEHEGDAALIKHIAERLTHGFYKGLLDWSSTLRSIEPPAKYISTFELTASLSDRPLQDFRTFVANYTTELNSVSDRQAQGDPGPFSIELTYVIALDDELVARLSSEIDALPSHHTEEE
ncbi:MAG TPA: hypothetical protein VL551_15655 [Actinospica sp.]|jgi:hypothetical protein|nr:hypothetical protein [Actinospica sp.]